VGPNKFCTFPLFKFLAGSMRDMCSDFISYCRRYIDSSGLSGPLPSSFSKLTSMKVLYVDKRCSIISFIFIPLNLILFYSSLNSGGRRIMILPGKYLITLGPGVIYLTCKIVIILCFFLIIIW
jgi:hypothetical protein